MDQQAQGTKPRREPPKEQGPKELDPYTLKLAAAFAEGTAGGDILECWYTDIVCEPIVCPTEIETIKRAALVEFIMMIYTNREIVKHVNT